jgi:hypothetical protein
MFDERAEKPISVRVEAKEMRVAVFLDDVPRPSFGSSTTTGDFLDTCPPSTADETVARAASSTT